MITALRLCQTSTVVVFLRLFSPSPHPLNPSSSPPVRRAIPLIRDLDGASRCPPVPPRGVFSTRPFKYAWQWILAWGSCGGILSGSSLFLHNFIRLGWALYRLTWGTNSFYTSALLLHHDSVTLPTSCGCFRFVSGFWGSAVVSCTLYTLFDSSIHPISVAWVTGVCWSLSPHVIGWRQGDTRDKST